MSLFRFFAEYRLKQLKQNKFSFFELEKNLKNLFMDLKQNRNKIKPPKKDFHINDF